MADISTSFVGIKLNSPVIVGACTLSRNIDNFKKAEDAGAGAMVVYSLFQEQIEHEALELDEELEYGSDVYAESLTYLPHMDSAGPREHIMWVEKSRKAVSFPIIGSLNATSLGNWTEYAKLLENAGCDALELNLYSIETDPNEMCCDIEEKSLEIISAVDSEVKIPVIVKLSPWYTSVANFASRAVSSGADGLVMFNRFYQPFIDTDTETLKIKLNPSNSEETRLPLRWIAILSEEINADIAASTGVHSGRDVARHLLAGAKAVECVSALYQNGLGHIRVMNRELSDWMDSKGYAKIDDFRGKLNHKKIEDPYAFERAQYVKFLLSE